MSWREEKCKFLFTLDLKRCAKRRPRVLFSLNDVANGRCVDTVKRL
jgi:hypothetical protein